MPLQHAYIANHITIASADWMDYSPDPATHPNLSAPEKVALTVKARVETTGEYPIVNPQQSYIDKVVKMLDKIRQSTLGANLINAICAEPHVVTIKIPSKVVDEGMRLMRCSPSGTSHGADTNLFLQLVGDIVRGNQAAARAELAAALQAAQSVGYSAAQIAATAVQLAQSAASVQSCGSPMGPPVAIPARNLVLTGPLITSWSTGAVTPIPDGYNLRYLALSLERWLTRGTGCGCTVTFDPWIKCDGLIKRPPIVSLFHELIHAYYNVKGMTIFTPGGQEEIEMMYIPCGNFASVANGGPARVYTENAFRRIGHLAADRQYV